MQEPSWKYAIAYQIYPRSFCDSNGDGIGDLRGILSKLDHLQSLGVKVVWLCPMYQSPMDDNGYDISDYQAIHPEFGTMADFDALLHALHSRGMKLIIDLVVNHTSDEHPWFLESRSSRENPKRDWYIWRDGKNNKEPNNWESIFGGSAWEIDKKTGQYFLHLFSKKQPDLNWDNLEMRAAIFKMVRWWMDKGVDGFRLDAISHMKKAPGFPDLPNPEKLNYVPSYSMHMNYPGVLEYLRELCRETFSKYSAITVGEANGVGSQDVKDWVGEGPERLNMLFQFEHLGLWNTDPKQRIALSKLKEVLSRWQACGAWNALYVENHDIPRIVSLWGNTEKYWRESATCIAALYYLMRGTPFIYQGQEIGMTNTVFNKLEDFDDVRAKNLYQQRREEGKIEAEILAELAPTSRDNARTPMQWTSEKNAGFTSGKPWLAINPNFTKINVQAQESDPNSILQFYRALAKLRASDEVFVLGDYQLLMENHPQMYVYQRTLKSTNVAIACNLSENAAELELQGKILLSNYQGKTSSQMRAYETRIIRLN